MKTLLKLFAFLVGVLLVVWGGLLISLGQIGETVRAEDVTVRRLGGERQDAKPNRYDWSISYSFTTRAGKTIHGNTQDIGDAMSVKRPTRITYLPAFPYINAPAEDAGLGMLPLLLIGAGGLVVFGIIRSSRSGHSKGKKSSRSRKSSGHTRSKSGSATSVDVKTWVRQYRKNARRYAWFFFAGVVVFIAIMVRIGLDGWNQEWAMATGFAVLVTWILAVYTRRTAESSWTGTVLDKEIKEVRSRDSSSSGSTYSYLIHLGTSKGKKKLRVSASLFSHFIEGQEYRKLAGLNYPLPTHPDAPALYCPVCGNDFKGALTQCPSCRAPVIRLAELENGQSRGAQS